MCPPLLIESLTKMDIDKKSWHYYVATKYGGLYLDRRWNGDEYIVNSCVYVKAVAIGLLVLLLLAGLIVLAAWCVVSAVMWIGFAIYWWDMWLFPDGEMYRMGRVVTVLGMFILVLVMWMKILSMCKRFYRTKLIKDGVPPACVSLIKQVSKNWHDKVCTMVTFH